MRQIKFFIVFSIIFGSLNMHAAQVVENWASQPTGQTLTPTSGTIYVDPYSEYQPPTNWVPRPTTTTTTTTTAGTPLLSTVPQFNVSDVKVTADGKCQIIKNGAIVKTDVYAGSPCQKIYGNNLQASGTTSTSTSTTTYTEEIPDIYFQPNFDSLQQYNQQSTYQSY
jgi:hypothetical protein